MFLTNRKTMGLRQLLAEGVPMAEPEDLSEPPSSICQTATTQSTTQNSKQDTGPFLQLVLPACKSSLHTPCHVSISAEFAVHRRDQQRLEQTHRGSHPVSAGHPGSLLLPGQPGQDWKVPCHTSQSHRLCFLLVATGHTEQQVWSRVNGGEPWLSAHVVTSPSLRLSLSFLPGARGSKMLRAEGTWTVTLSDSSVHYH